MARSASILIPASDVSLNIAALAAVTASAIQTIGKNRIFVINADQDISIKFGMAGTLTAATAASYRIPANQQVTLDTGPALDSFYVFNLNGTTAANVYIQLLSVV